MIYLSFEDNISEIEKYYTEEVRNMEKKRKINKEQIFKIICKTIENVTENEIKENEIHMEDSFNKGSLILSSFDYIKVIVGIEKEMNIIFPEELLDFSEITKVKDLVNILYEIQAN